MTDYNNLPESALIRQSQLLAGLVPFSSATLWRRVKANQFPKPIKLDGGHITAWRWGEIKNWLEAQGQPEKAA